MQTKAFKKTRMITTVGPTDGTKPLATVFDEHSYQHTLTIRHLFSYNQRRDEGLTNRHAGRPITPWETPFLAAWGLDWRTLRDSDLK